MEPTPRNNSRRRPAPNSPLRFRSCSTPTPSGPACVYLSKNDQRKHGFSCFSIFAPLVEQPPTFQTLANPPSLPAASGRLCERDRPRADSTCESGGRSSRHSTARPSPISARKRTQSPPRQPSQKPEPTPRTTLGDDLLRKLSELLYHRKLEPTVGIEPTTCGLRNRCSTS